jgi:hypothetical protein
MDAEELVHCQTVARMLVNRVLSKISQRFGRLNPERATGTPCSSGEADRDDHGAGNWRDDDTLAAEEFFTR